MRSEPVCGLILGLVLVAGCKPDPHRPDAAPPWWKPTPGEAADWDIQLAPAAADFDVSMPRAMYTIDLWDAVPAATTLDYGDGTPVAIPMGAHPGAIAQIHAQSPSAIVACHVGMGAIHLDDPDALKFPGYEVSPPNRPDPVKPGSVIGWSVSTTDPNERFINIHPTEQARVLPLIRKRIELAQIIGCDAVLARYNDQLAYQADPGHGFPDLTAGEAKNWAQELATSTHELRISIGLRAETALGTDGTAQTYDWLMIERCGEYDQCDQVKPYIDARKAVFALEYDVGDDGVTPNVADDVCKKVKEWGVDAVIFKKATLDKYRTTCP